MKIKIIIPLVITLLSINSYADECNTFTKSTLNIPDNVKKTILSLNYPEQSKSFMPWLSENFEEDWKKYMTVVLSSIESDVSFENEKITLVNYEKWFSSPWMDYGNAGREPLNGLTRERGPRPKDVAPNSPGGGQVWAVGWYNDVASTTLSEVFKNPCDPVIDSDFSFSEGSVAIKFLFTTLDENAIPYLKGSPTIKSYIDPSNIAGRGRPNQRVISTLRLLQVDIAVKDKRALDTGWVFGTFAWMNSASKTVFDSLVPVSLAWGDDPAVYNDDIKQSRINTELHGLMFGWDERPFLGFMGRANGPADNAISSCISCHGSAQFPRPKIGNLDTRTSVQSAMKNFNVRKKLVDSRFVNQPAGSLFDDSIKGAVGMDYSLQLQAGIERLCEAWCNGDLIGEPSLCKLDTGFRYTPARCDTLKGFSNNKFLRLKPEAFIKENLPNSEIQKLLDNPRG
ncbi:MAG: hypothetical protein HRU04_05500 [Oceanospirillaceae bacterium]|nr:hypothetical protein [Oceanospirillaceae bacterium]